MFPARGEFVKLGKGSLLLDLLDPITDLPTGLQFTGNASAIEINTDIAKVELFSSTQASAGLVATDRTKLGYTVVATMNEFTIMNLKLWLLGKSQQVDQVAGSAVPASFEGVQLGNYYSLGARRVTTVVGLNIAVPLVAGVDYDLNSEYGTIFLRPGATHIADGDDIDFTFTKAVQVMEKIQIGTAGSQIARLEFMADDANTAAAGAHDHIVCWRVDVAPNGSLALISQDYGSFGLSMGVLSDGTNHPDEPYGTWTRIR